MRGNMKNAYASQLQARDAAHTKGVNDGFTTATALVLLAIYNRIDEYIGEDKQGQFARDIEAEMNRLFKDEFNWNADISDLVIGHIEEIRKKWGMDG